MKSGLKPAVKNRAAHGGEECAARMVKTKADALGIGGLKKIPDKGYATESAGFAHADLGVGEGNRVGGKRLYLGQ